MSKQFNCSKHLIMFFPSKNMGINRLHLGVTIRFSSSSSIKGLDEMLRCESSALSPFCLIEDEALKFHHVTDEEETSCNTCRSIFFEHLRCNHVSTGVY